MRKSLFMAGCASLVACACLAGEAYVVQLPMGTNAAASVVVDLAIRGAVDSIYIACVTNGVLKANEEADVWLTYALHHGGGSADLVSSNSITGGAATWRPRVIGTTQTGASLAAASVDADGTNSVPTVVLSAAYEPIVLTGEPVTLHVAESTTGVVWRAVIVIKEKR